jgi:hypothetical protein
MTYAVKKNKNKKDRFLDFFLKPCVIFSDCDHRLWLIFPLTVSLTPSRNMGPTVRDLIVVLQIFFPGDLLLHRALYVLGVILSVYPLYRLHINQRRQPGQRVRTAWLNSIHALFQNALTQIEGDPPIWAAGEDRGAEYAEYLSTDLGPLYSLLGLNPNTLCGPIPH